MVKILEEVPFKISTLHISGSSYLTIRNTEALDFEKLPNIFNFTVSLSFIKCFSANIKQSSFWLLFTSNANLLLLIYCIQ